MTRDYQAELIEALRDPDEAAEYLNAALEDGEPEIFILALKNVAEAQSSMFQSVEKSERATFNQDNNINRMFSQQPRFDIYSLDALLQALGFHLAIQRVS
jgi:DNA-binding phage protein